MIELAVVCGLLIALMAWQQFDRRAERREVRAERADLLLRIQAPQYAAIRDFNEKTEEDARELPFDDDEAHWETRGLSRDELAERLATEAEMTRG